MTRVWEHGGLSAGEIVEQLSGPTGWTQRTIRTLVQRLLRKGALACDSRRRPAIYRPAVTQEDCVREESQSLVRRVFKGAQSLFLINLIKETELTPAEIQELKKILKEKEKP